MALVVRLDGRDMTADPSRPELLPPCSTPGCGHAINLHLLTTKPPRTHKRCSVSDQRGKCQCSAYEAAKS